MKIPQGIFPRYQVWSAEYGLKGIEDPWFAINYLGSALARSEVTRRQIKRFSIIQDELLKLEDHKAWWKVVASAFASLDFSLLDIRTDELVEEGELGSIFAGLFPDAKSFALPQK